MAQDCAHNLVKVVIRMFYPDPYIIVVEGLLTHPYYIEDDKKPNGDMATRFSAKPKTIRYYMAKLHKHGLIHKKEIKNKSYWFIHLPHFIMLVRLRIKRLQQEVENFEKRTALDDEALDETDENKMKIYECPNCSTFYTVPQAEAMHFNCNNCELKPQLKRRSDILKEKTEAAALTNSKMKREKANMSKKFSQQFREEQRGADLPSLFALLKRCDDYAEDIPVYDPATELERKEEIERSKKHLEKLREERRLAYERRGETPPGDDVPLESGNIKIHRSILFGDTYGAGDLEDDPEELERERIARSKINLGLPAWHKTTVTGKISSVAITDEQLRSTKRLKPEAGGTSGYADQDITETVEAEIVREVKRRKEFKEKLARRAASMSS